MNSKKKILTDMLLAICIASVLLIVMGYIMPRYNSMQQDAWYNEDIDTVALGYYHTVHTEQCEPQITHYSYSYNNTNDENNNQYPFSSVDVTVRCDHGEYLITVENENGYLKAATHSLSEPSAPFWFILLLQIIIVAVVVVILLVDKYLKKKQIRLM